MEFCTPKTIYMNESIIARLQAELSEIKDAGLFKKERIIESPQGPVITVGGQEVINLCANNYLGLSSHPKIIEAAKKYIDESYKGLVITNTIKINNILKNCFIFFSYAQYKLMVRRQKMYKERP